MSTANDRQLLDEVYRFFRGQLALCDLFLEEKRTVVDGPTFRKTANEISRVIAGTGNLLPAFAEDLFFSHHDQQSRYYKVSALRAYVVSALGILGQELGITKSSLAAPSEVREFPFVKDPQLRNVVERDYAEIQRGVAGQCWKSSIILSAGAIEAILLDLVLQEPARARKTKHAPEEADPTLWHLIDLINVAVEMGRISPGIQKFSHSVRAYRNLVHPAQEVRTGMKIGEEEAKIALEVLHIICRDLTSERSNG